MARPKSHSKFVSPGVERRGQGQYRVRIRRGDVNLTETFETQDDAERWRADMLARLRAEGGDMLAMERQQRAAAANLTLGQICKDYRENVTPGHKSGETEAYRLQRWERDHPLRDRTLNSITSSDISAWRDKRLTKDKRKPDTVIYELHLLHRVLEYARREKGVLLPSGNPVSQVKKPRSGVGRDRRISWRECVRLARETKKSRGPWLWPLILLAIETGMRRSELLTLTWQDVALKHKTAHLRDTKNGKSRTVPLSRHARRALHQLQGLAEKQREQLEDPPALETLRVIPASANAVKMAWQRCRDRAKLDDLRFHDLRHEATSRLFEKGFNIMEVASITGHQDLRMLRRYTHMDAQRLAQRLG